MCVKLVTFVLVQPPFPATQAKTSVECWHGCPVQGGIIKKVLIWFVLLVVLIVVACMIGWALSLTGLAGKYVAIIVVAVIAIARCLPLYIHMFYLRMARGEDASAYAVSLDNAVNMAIQTAGAQPHPCWLPWVMTAGWWGFVALPWLVNVVLAAVVGRVVLVGQADARKGSIYAALLVAILELTCLRVLLSMMAPRWGYTMSWLTPVPLWWECAVLTAFSWNCICDVKKRSKIGLFTPACLHASCVLALRCVWIVERAVLTVLVDVTVGRWFVCFLQLGQLPWRVIPSVDPTAAAKRQQRTRR